LGVLATPRRGLAAPQSSDIDGFLSSSLTSLVFADGSLLSELNMIERSQSVFCEGKLVGKLMKTLGFHGFEMWIEPTNMIVGKVGYR
jgi:hypothetical protein